MPTSYKKMLREKSRQLQDFRKYVAEQRDRLLKLCGKEYLECHHLKEAVDITEKTEVLLRKRWTDCRDALDDICELCNDCGEEGCACVIATKALEGRR